jgi:probable regulatory domain-containing protein
MSEVPLKPLGKEDIKKLELALIMGTLFRGDVLKQAIETHDKLTWLDSLLVAAGALARERAGIPTFKIAEELGRTEATIRSHLQGKTEAGKLVKETYDELVKKGGKLEITLPELGISSQALTELQEKVKKLEEENRELKLKIEQAKEKLREIVEQL